MTPARVLIAAELGRAILVALEAVRMSLLFPLWQLK
jgi:hypothetical protein